MASPAYDLRRCRAGRPRCVHQGAGADPDWPRDPWALAGYAFPAPGQVTTVGPLLHKGLGRLHFAGEYACYKFVGYMEGALNSGVSVARRLAARDGLITSRRLRPPDRPAAPHRARTSG